jgi:hypothetical protein
MQPRPFVGPPLRAAVAALALTLGLPAAAQEAGFAVELAPTGDFFQPLRIGVRVFGQTVEPAAGFVRGCPGHVIAEAAGASFEVTEVMDSLAFTAAGDAVEALIVATPDGLFRCARAGAVAGMVSAQFARAEAGRYRVWVAGAEGTELSARLIASEAPVSALELRGLDIATLAPPRAGRFTFDPSENRQVLVQNATLYPEAEMRPLDLGSYCAGYSRFDAADAVLTLAQPQRQFSIFAMSERDLTIAVVAPDGSVLCNDDTYQLHPAVTFTEAQSGDYHVFVGGYSMGGSAAYDLFASPGGAAFTDVMLDLSATPRAGAGVLDLAAARAGTRLAAGQIVSSDPVQDLPTGQFCVGFTGTDAPDYVLTLPQGAPLLSLYAMSGTDLVLAARGPGGEWLCNDDSFGLNPAVSFTDAAPGEYHIFVGAFSPDARGGFNLYAALGNPNWDSAQPGPGGAALGFEEEPLVGRIGFGPQTRVDPRLIFDVLPSDVPAFDLGQGCAGYITPDRPDIVISAEPGLPQLMVYMVAEADGTLAVVGPDGTIHCNDDFEGLNPGVMIPNPQPGDYAVFAGTYGGSGGVATLGVTIASPLWVMDREH